MNIYRWAGIGSMTAMMLVGGCKSASNSTVSSNTTKPPVQTVQPKRAPIAVEAAQNDAPLPEAVAQKTTEYARSLEPAVNAPGAVPPAQSPVQWTEPKTHPRAAANTPAALSSATASPGPAQLASATDTAHLGAVTNSTRSNALNDVPAIVPESSDFPSVRVGSDSLEAKLAKQVHDNPRDVAAELDYELYGVLKDEPTPQLASISMLPNEDRELVAALVDGVSNFRSAVRQDNNMLLSKKIVPILDMADRVRTHAELSIPVVALCKRVDGYGKYDPIDPARFPAGQPNPVIVYCEIANFASQPDENQMWQTKLRQGVTLYTETGMPVWHEKSRDVTDECRNRRHDFFLYDLVKLPANLSVGRYILKITIEDLTANRVREATVPVEMIAQ